MKSHALDSNGLAQCQILLAESVRAIHEVVEQSNDAISQVGADFRTLVDEHHSLHADRRRLAADIEQLTLRVRADLNELTAQFYRLARQAKLSSARVQHSTEPIALQIEAALAMIASVAQTQPGAVTGTELRHRVVRALQFNDLTAQALSEVANGALPTVAKLLTGPDAAPVRQIQPARSNPAELVRTIERVQSGTVELF